MGARGVTSKESSAAQSRIIFLLIVYVHLVTSQRSSDVAEVEAPPCPPSPPQLPYSSLNFCPDHLITQILDALTTCTPPPPPHDGGDLSPQERVRTATFAEVVLTALSGSRKDEGTTPWEVMFKLMFPAAVCALLFCGIPLENSRPRFAHIIEKLLVILSVNALMALLLPAELFWVPALCYASSLLTFIIAPWLP